MTVFARTFRQRPLRDVPPAWRWTLAIALCGQVLWHAQLPSPVARAAPLPPAPPPEMLRIVSFGEPAVFSRLLSLWLQAFDNQPGISIPYVELDYGRVSAWLEASLRLDPRNGYPLLAATHLYADVPDPARTRRMLRLVEREFERDPAGRWRWMAHAVLIAKHRLHDLPLALRLARRLTERTRPGAAPGWARQMSVFVLEDLGEYEAAAALLGALLESARLDGEQERRFLLRRLDGLQKNVEK